MGGDCQTLDEGVVDVGAAVRLKAVDVVHGREDVVVAGPDDHSLIQIPSCDIVGEGDDCHVVHVLPQLRQDRPHRVLRLLHLLASHAARQIQHKHHVLRHRGQVFRGHKMCKVAVEELEIEIKLFFLK